MEIYFDLAGSGFLHQDGYAFQGGPGRVFFDVDTKQFLRIEPVGGVQPTQTEGAPEAKPARKDNKS